jgi:hypothetical protein
MGGVVTVEVGESTGVLVIVGLEGVGARSESEDVLVLLKLDDVPVLCQSFSNVHINRRWHLRNRKYGHQ